MELKLTINVEYEPNGVSEEQLKGFLEDLARRAAGEGLFTWDSPAEVTTWRFAVETVSK